MLRIAVKIGAWISIYLLGSCVYFAFTHRLVESTPALLIPSLIPLSALSTWVSWRIEQEIEPAYIEPSVDDGKVSILPLLYMSVFYSSVVEGFLYEWVLHGGLRPWLSIALDVLWLSPFFTDAAATYVYKRLLGEDHENASEFVSNRLPTFVVPLIGFWFVFSVAGNKVSNPILSFMIFDFGIVVWTVFFTWASHSDFPKTLRTSRHAFARHIGVFNDVLSRPLARIYAWNYFGSYLLDLLILIFSLAIASELWLANFASPTFLATLILATFGIWKAYEFWKQPHRQPAPIQIPAPDAKKPDEALNFPAGRLPFELNLPSLLTRRKCRTSFKKTVGY